MSSLNNFLRRFPGPSERDQLGCDPNSFVNRYNGKEAGIEYSLLNEGGKELLVLQTSGLDIRKVADFVISSEAYRGGQMGAEFAVIELTLPAPGGCLSFGLQGSYNARALLNAKGQVSFKYDILSSPARQQFADYISEVIEYARIHE